MNNVRIAMLGSGFVADFYLQGLANVKGQQVVVNFPAPANEQKSLRGDGRYRNPPQTSIS